jgi:spore maturation protein CgeB
VYETVGRGGFIIHPKIEGLDEEFEDKKHLVFYDYQDFDQLDGLIDYYLKNDSERESIRIAGHELVKEKYTYTNRWKTILKEMGI